MLNVFKILFVFLAFTSTSHAKSGKHPGETAYLQACRKTVTLPYGRANDLCKCRVQVLQGKGLNYNDKQLGILALPEKKLTKEEQRHNNLHPTAELIEMEMMREVDWNAHQQCHDRQKARTAKPIEE